MKMFGPVRLTAKQFTVSYGGIMPHPPAPRPQAATVTHNLTQETIEHIFAEWNRRYFDDPEAFAEHTKDDASERARYFLEILEEL